MPGKSFFDPKKTQMLAPAWRGLFEVGFIIFLYYSNLLMGEYEGSGQGQIRGLRWALHDIFTTANFAIALATAIVGHLVIEVLRKRR
jgi:hypothetical protein